MADLNSQLRELHADFQRIADRAPWVRAACSVKNGRFGLFTLGHPEGDGSDAALVRSVGDPKELAIVSELDVLTNHAGDLTSQFLRAGGGKGNIISTGSVTYHLQQPWELWLFLLLHTPPLLMHCWTKGLDGNEFFAFSQPSGNDVAVWIDNYPQVCVSALGWLKSKSAPGLAAKTG